ncbi:zeta toxin family protein [Edaphobacter sp. HDX4]|uniref:zeta toxin family protein n=1 Tax=Edaphobacter sp. HDX4 TaxID=2794064 RepID=UPI002FE5C1EC
MSTPVLTIIAGPNGSGKSTLTSSAREIFQQAPVLDPDAIVKSLQETITPNHSDMEAGRRVLLLAEELIASRQSFTVETTLSGNTYLRMASRAKAAGFSIMVVFVGTSSVEINIERVKARVEKGGHDVPEEVQRRRFPRTLKNMKKLLPDADLAVVLDNSSESGYVLVAFGSKGNLHWNEPVPEWAAQLRS